MKKCQTHALRSSGKQHAEKMLNSSHINTHLLTGFVLITVFSERLYTVFYYGQAWKTILQNTGWEVWNPVPVEPDCMERQGRPGRIG